MCHNSQRTLDAYLISRAKVYPIARSKAFNMEIGVLFLAVRNRYEKSSTNIEPINVRSIARMLLYMTQVRGLQPMHPHLLRHACATHMLDNGCPLDVIAQILGHDNLDVTAHYAQVSTRLMNDGYLQRGASARESTDRVALSCQTPVIAP